MKVKYLRLFLHIDFITFLELKPLQTFSNGSEDARAGQVCPRQNVNIQQ